MVFARHRKGILSALLPDRCYKAYANDQGMLLLIEQPVDPINRKRVLYIFNDKAGGRKRRQVNEGKVLIDAFSVNNHLSAACPMPVLSVFFHSGNPILFTGFNIIVVSLYTLVFLKSMVVEIDGFPGL